MATNAVNKRIKDIVLFGKRPTKEEQVALTQVFKKDFLKKGNKHLVEVLKGEFKDIEVKIGINVANKAKNLGVLNDKIFSIFQFIMANPQGFVQSMQVPAIAKSFNDILE